MRKILVVTGRLAEKSVRKYCAQSDLETEVVTLPISVATFMTSECVIKELRKKNLRNFSMLMVPGLVWCDLKKVEDELGLPTFKGPEYPADIPRVLKNLSRIKLSKSKPADELLNLKMLASAEKELRKIERTAWKSFSEPENFLVGKGKSAIAVGKGFPIRVVAEIADAPLLSDEEVIGIAKRYLESGAEILDIGMTAREMPEEVPRLIAILRENFNVPISIDSLNKKEIRAAIDSGIDLVVSINADALGSFSNLDVPAVLIPFNLSRNYHPRSASEKIKYLSKLIEKAEKLGYRHPIADPILEPLNQGFMESLTVFYWLRKRKPEVPIFMGIGNVIELCDADSVGMSALLVGAANEINASFLLTVEASDKTRWNVAEVRRARDMMLLAKSRGRIPKDLGLDLLLLKEKRRPSGVYDKKIEKKVKVVRVTKGPPSPPTSDKRFFRIFTDEPEIVAVAYSKKGVPELVLRSRKGKEICKEIVHRGLAKDPNHVAYLSRELQKAELAIKTGRGYLEGEELF